MPTPEDGRTPDPLEIARRACRERGLDEDDAPIVAQMMRRPESCWAPCCNDNCSPCNDDYAAAARLGQRLLQASSLVRSSGAGAGASPG